jgi:3-oxosteroid 1-dehydrogenase
MDGWNYEFDLLVAGSGAGGMVAALVAKQKGLDSVVLEKTEYYGGSTALSGGGLWIPDNYLMAGAGIHDSLEDARIYMNNTVGERVQKAKQEAYITRAREMLVYLRDHSHAKFQIMMGYPDYYPERPGATLGGRALEPLLFEGRRLGQLFDQLRPHPYLPAATAFTLEDWLHVSMARANPSKWMGAIRWVFRTLLNILLRKRHLTLGRALIGRLRLSLHENNVPLWLNAGVKSLIVEKGRVVGVEADSDGKRIRIRGKKGVVLAAGGFPHNGEMREKHGQHPGTFEWTCASPGNWGEAIQMGVKAGAAVDLMDDAWWGPSTLMFGGPPVFLVTERAYPGAIMVDSRGKRFVNESAPYIDVVHAMYQGDSRDSVTIPSHFIWDRRYRSRYFFGVLAPGITPRSYLKQEHFARAKTLEQLADQTAIDPQGLIETVERFNDFARRGKDQDFGRGDSIYDRFYADSSVKPNPCLAPIERPPFYAVKVYPGDLGTKGGLMTNAHAQVLREDGTLINGLYAIGNTSASVMGNSYPGPGATIAPSMTFGYIAALHAADT